MFELPDHEGHLEILRRTGLYGTAPEIDAALEALPQVFRAAVLLVDVDELTYEEAAAVTGCPVGTLRSRLFRGRKLLAVALQD